MRPVSLHRQTGLNLIEILVAALILSFGLLSLAGLQVASLKSAQNAGQQQQAAFVIHELLERMRSNREAALAGDYIIESYSCSSASAPTACNTDSVCTPKQMAAFDLYQVQCGTADSSNAGDSGVNQVDSGVEGQLIDGKLSVACPTGDCGQGLDVTLSWLERQLGGQTQEAQGGAGASGQTERFELTVNIVL